MGIPSTALYQSGARQVGNSLPATAVEDSTQIDRDLALIERQLVEDELDERVAAAKLRKQGSSSKKAKKNKKRKTKRKVANASSGGF